MADYTKAWLSYKMKALTNSKIWNKVTVIAEEKENSLPQTVDTAVKELTCAAKELFETELKSEKKKVSFFDGESSAAELKKLTGCEDGLVLVYFPALKNTYKEGYRLTVTESAVYIVAGTGRGVLYGAFDVIRTEIIEEKLSVCDKKVIPDNPLRMMNHWDNMDNSIERGYSGESFFFVNNEVVVNDRTREYARLCASVGINASVINNVNVKNAATYLITPRYEKELKEMSEIFAEYGVDLYLSLNFAAPMELAGLPVSDPLNEDVRAWWKDTMKNVFTAIPKLAGFLVKADSEGRPGPHTYGRTQAEGANMLAEMVAPFDGKIIWRCFVYNCTQDWRDYVTDRARAQYDNFYYANGVSTINLDNIPSGIYFYTVRSGDDVMTGKLVVE